MNYCRKWQETLWLDVHGELSPRQRTDWKQHLKGCKPCRQERERLLYLLRDITEAMPEAILSSKDADILHNDVMEKLGALRNKQLWRQQSLFKGPIKAVYALAACCLVLAVFGWFGLKKIHQGTRVGTVSNLRTNEQLITKDMDLLENLDLLKDMDTLEKLDQVMGKGTKAT
jgi:predicted anti-sigma-YlaC factor YlaD